MVPDLEQVVARVVNDFLDGARGLFAETGILTDGRIFDSMI